MKSKVRILKLFLVSLAIFFTTFISNSIQAQVQIYANDFESTGGFYTDTINSIWERGIPQKAVIDTAHNGQNVWLTDLDSAYQGAQNSFLYSPQIVIAPFDSGSISFWQFVDLDTALLSGKDICSISYRTDKNNQWLTLGYIGYNIPTNWFNAYSNGIMGWNYDSSGWFNSSFPFYRKNSSNCFYNSNIIQFRFNLISYAGHSSAGWALDDFKVSGWGPSANVGVTDILLPKDSTSMYDSIPVRIRVKNYGPGNLSYIQTSIMIDSSLVLCESFNLITAIAPDSSIDLNLTNKYKAPPYNYHITAITKSPSDTIYSNDTLSKTITSILARYDLAAIGIEVSNAYHDTIKLTKKTPVTLMVVNCGYDTIDSASFTYIISPKYTSSQYPVTENWTGVLKPNDTLNFTFNKPITGEIGYFYLSGISHTSGDYYKDNDSIKKLLLSTVDIGFTNYSSNHSALKIFPNPTHATISIDLKKYRNAVCSLSIFNSLGKEIKQLLISKKVEKIKIDISTLSPGLYYIQLRNEQQVLGNGKFIKE